MKNWGLIVAALYALILVVLTVPVIMLAFVPSTGLKAAASTYLDYQYWVWLIVMFIGQLALLSIPVRLTSLRAVSRGPVWWTVITGGFMAGLLAVGAFLSLYEFFTDSKNGTGTSDWWGWTAIALGMLTWSLWTLVFIRMSRNTEPSDLVTRQCRALFKGSVLELLIAVPTHIAVRCRDYCCAGVLTFIGLTMGFSVMLFTFGPVVLVLFVQRWQKLHPKPPLKK